MAALRPDLCVIGAGSAGLTVAAGASQMGATVVLVERGEMGGDCLNHGCVPSKALIAASRAARDAREAGRFGVLVGEPAVDFAAVHRHVHGVVAAIAPNDSVERFEGLGVRVLRGGARFTGPRALSAAGEEIRPRRVVIAAGAGPFVPPLPGLADVPFLTNETVFGLTERPRQLVVLGGGPIGCELAQAFSRLGSEVTLVEMAGLLPRDDQEAAEVVRLALRRDGVVLMEGVRVAEVSGGPGYVALKVQGADGTAAQVEGTHLLVAAGRRANVEGLGLDLAGIAHDARGIAVDARLRTSDPKVYAIGDVVAGGLQFTHVAGHHAAVVLKNALFRLPAKAERETVPWVTYTDPELAHVGLGEASARERHGAVRILRWGLAENDRAQAEREVEGFVKAMVTPRGRILGATIVARHAGELILPWVLALRSGLKIGAMAQAIAPYPTLSEASRRAAGSFYAPKLFAERTRRIVRLLARLG